MGKILKLARPQFLVAGLALFLFGAFIAVSLGSPFSLARLVLGCLIVLPAQLSVNFGNDYFDVVSDQLDGGTFISGGSGILLKHPELRGTVKWIIAGLILFSLIMGVIFQQRYSYPFWMFGFVILGNLLGWMYSAPPFRLLERGLGEICFVFVIGFLLPMTGYLTMRGVLDPAGSFVLLPLLFYGFVFILSVEIPDLEGDILGGKRNWITRIGRPFGFTAVGLFLLGATAWFFLAPRFYATTIPVDFRVIGGLSLLPLLPGLWGLLRRPAERQPATQITTAIVIGLTLFAVLMDLYLFVSII
jgi:1,4-dihydroxy-2-naphthoate octaprenyltransferase